MIDKGVREEAALLCALMASSREPSGREVHDFETPCLAIGVDCFRDDAANLARAAYWRVPKNTDLNASINEQIRQLNAESPSHWAEAEAMLRTGWTPEGACSGTEAITRLFNPGCCGRCGGCLTKLVAYP